jgi:hypothetical protein
MQISQKSLKKLDTILGLLFFTICMLRFQAFLKNCLGQSSDLCWLIRTGDWILLHKDLPTTDLFSWWQPARLVVPYQWTFEIFASLLNKTAGVWSIGLFSNVVGSIFLFWILPRNWLLRNIPFSITFAMLSLVSSAYWHFPRPQLFVWVYSAFLLYLLEEARRKDETRYLFLLPPLILLWVNAHPSFAFALLTITIYFVVGALKKKVLRTQISLGAIFIASALSTILTPKGTLFVSHAMSFANGGQYLRIHEVLPAYQNPDLHPFLAYSILACALIAFFWKNLPLEKCIVSLFFIALGISVNRFEPLSIIASWSCVGDSITLGLSKYLRVQNSDTACIRASDVSAGHLWRSGSSFFVALLIGCVLWKADVPNEREAQAQLLNYADRSLLLMPEQRGKTRLFNDPICGNWMIFTGLGRPFMSNQFDSYKPQTISEVVKVLNGDNFSTFLNTQEIDCILIQNYCPLHKALKNSSQWTLIRGTNSMSYWERTN